MKKMIIEKLTPEQIARLPEYAAEWTRIGLCTDPADRPRAEAAIRSMYSCAGLAPPRIVWCGSPLSQGLTRAIVRKFGGASVGDSVRDSVRASVYGAHDAEWLAFYRVFHDFGLRKQTANAAAPHDGYDLPPGVYEFRCAREFDPFAEQARRVAD